MVLVGAVGYGGVKWLADKPRASALEYTVNTMAELTTAIGVQGMAVGDTENDDDLDVVTAGLDGIKVYIIMAEKLLPVSWLMIEMVRERR